MRNQFNGPWERRPPGGDGEEGMPTSHGGQIQDTVQPTLNSILPRGLHMPHLPLSHYLLPWGLDSSLAQLLRSGSSLTAWIKLLGKLLATGASAPHSTPMCAQASRQWLYPLDSLGLTPGGPAQPKSQMLSGPLWG